MNLKTAMKTVLWDKALDFKINQWGFEKDDEIKITNSARLREYSLVKRDMNQLMN